MSFIYINPGFAEMLKGPAFTTVRNNFTYSPLTGVSFTKSYSSGTGTSEATWTMPFPAYSKSTQSNEIHFYGKMNVYFTGGNAPKIRFSFPARKLATQTTNDEFLINGSDAAWKIYLGSDVLATREHTTTGYLPDKLNQLWFHVRFSNSDTVSATVSFKVNETAMSASHSCFLPTTSSLTSFYGTPTGSASGTPYFSGFILSDEEIPADAQLAILPAGNIETNMASVGGGLYTPKSGDPTWLMTPNITPLLESHLSSTKVYGLAVGANPCQTTGTTTFTTLSKSGDTVTEHGTVTVTSADSAFCDGWLTEDTTLGDLANMQLGLKSGG